MAWRLCSALLVLLAVECIGGNEVPNSFDVKKYDLTYYNLLSGAALKGELEDSNRDPTPMPKIGYRSLPCECHDLTCVCCAGVNVTSIKLNQRACTRFTYDPYDFAIKLQLLLNEREAYSNSFSAKNPPPICVPFVPLPIVSFCLRLFDLYTPGRNLHACLDFETRLIGSPILVLHFDCVKLGADGVSWAKPGDSTPEGSKPIPVTPPAPVATLEEYDEVDFEQQDELAAASNDTATLTPEEEDQIGQLKL